LDIVGQGTESLNIGVVWRLDLSRLGEDLAMLSGMGFGTCHLSVADPSLYARADTGDIKKAFLKANMDIDAIWCGLGPPTAWDLVDGPATIGLVPEAYRANRLRILGDCGRWCAVLGIRKVITHAGFIPEDRNDPRYAGIVNALAEGADLLSGSSCDFLLETGQETASALLGAIGDMGRSNVCVNLDTGNLLLYGKGDPALAVDILGSHIRGVHAKDGLEPLPGSRIGRETAIGEGSVRFAEVVSRLRAQGYEGDLMIEREIEGPRKLEDIRAARHYLLSLAG
jgi:sugar phosphate isomerase/epimerase